jgi:hypothetical protein
VQSEVGLTARQIKTKTPRIPRISRIFEILDPVLGQIAPVQTYHPLGHLHPCNPWRFSFLAQFALKAAASC